MWGFQATPHRHGDDVEEGFLTIAGMQHDISIRKRDGRKVVRDSIEVAEGTQIVGVHGVIVRNMRSCRA